jgi:two-component system cell cycle sensor histidine kinase/response regulator CckA
MLPAEGAKTRITRRMQAMTEQELDAMARPASALSHLPDEPVILVVEDEPGIRDAIGTVLAQEGFTVLTAVDGENALEVVSQFAEPINLVITDLVMPVMSGRALFDDLRRWFPRLPFLFVSGYLPESLDSDPRLADPHTACLAKPIDFTDLVNAADRLLALDS